MTNPILTSKHKFYVNHNLKSYSFRNEGEGWELIGTYTIAEIEILNRDLDYDFIES